MMHQTISEKAKQKTWLDKLTQFSEHCIPDAFPLVMILTVVVAVAAFFFTGSTPQSIVQNWYDGFWSMLTFTMQVGLLMFSGYIVAESGLVKRCLVRIAKVPNNPRQSMILFIVVMAVLNYLHFAVAIAGAIMLGRAIIVEQAKKGNKIPYAMLVSIGFFGIMYQGGPTAGSPLLVASPGHFMEEVIGVIPLSESMLTLPMVLMNVTIFAIVLFVFPKLVPQKDYDTVDPALLIRFEKEMAVDTKEEAVQLTTFAQRVDNAWFFQKLVGVSGMLALLSNLISGGMSALNLNSVNFFFLMLALILHRSPASVLRSARNGIATISNIVLQYPFYAGIFGMIQFSGLGKIISLGFVSLATPRIFTFIVFVFSALLNMLVPSGGSQFMVEAPYIMPAAIEMGVNTAYVLNAFTVGDLITNLIQPFWALPALSVFGLQFRNIFPYCLIACCIGFVVMSAYFLLWMY